MKLTKKTSLLAGVALLAVGAMLGGFYAAETGQQPFSYSHVTASAAEAPQNVIELQNSLKSVVKSVQPAVVSVMSTQQVKTSSNGRGGQNPQIPEEFRDFFGFGFGGPQIPDPQPRSGLGSGVITSADGYILTNSHVVENADEVKVRLSDKREFVAEVVGADPLSDVAVLKIDVTGLPFAELGDSNGVEVGDLVLAMGNPFGIGQTVTMGIVGATGRAGMGIEEFEDFIQTDAAINPGNSGGALVNIHGQVIGVNTAIISRSGGNAGVGFAIPIRMASNVMDQLVNNGKVSRGLLGVKIQEVTPAIAKSFGLPGNPRGTLISEAEAGSPAAKAGIQQGDIVLGLNGNDVPDLLVLRNRIAEMKPGSTVDVQIFRDGKEQTIPVVLGERDGEAQISQGPGSTPSEAPQLGIEVEPVNGQNARQFGLQANTSGLVITNVVPGSAAARAGLTAGDVITQVNREPVDSAADLREMVRESDGSVLLLISREGSSLFVPIEAN